MLHLRTEEFFSKNVDFNMQALVLHIYLITLFSLLGYLGHKIFPQ